MAGTVSRARASVFTAVILTLVGGMVPAWADGAWRAARPMETGRAGAAAAVLDSQIYVAGGSSVIGPRNAFEVFDPNGEFWRPLPALPEAREQAAMASARGALYLTGGYEKESLEPSDDLWIYDAETGDWREGKPMPAGRGAHKLITAGGRLFVIGGEGPDAARVFAYDPGADQWSTMSWRLSEPRADVAAASDGASTIYVLGGKTARGETKRAERVNTATGKWQRLADLPLARSGHTAVLLDNRLHVTGGVSGETLKTYSDHNVLDLRSGKWTGAEPLPTPRRGLVSAAVNGRWYVIGGGSGAGFFTVFTEADVVEVFVPSGS
jgi:N-acetylneuraminic acid mutarotase